MSHKEYMSTYSIHVASRAADLTGVGLEYLLSADGQTIMARFYNGDFLGQPQSGDREPTKGVG